MNRVGQPAVPDFQLPLLSRLQQKESAGSSAPQSFPQMLQAGFAQVNDVQQDAHAQVHEMLTGGDVSQVEVLTAVQKADMAFRLLVQVRNKLMAAYEEINAIRV